MKLAPLIFCVALAAAPAFGHEYHVALNGADHNPGTRSAPLRTIGAAANLAMPGDTVTVHAGIYRERVSPPRGGTDDTHRITYQAAAGEKVTITGSEPAKGWQHVDGDTWKVVIPSKYFGGFNPYADLIRGDWYSPNGHAYHTGRVYLNGTGSIEAPSLTAVLAPAGPTPLWYGQVDGMDNGDYLVNVAWLKTGGASVPAAQESASHGTQAAPCSEGGQCVGFIRAGDWLRYDNIDFGADTERVDLRVASASESAEIELRLDSANGALLGTAHAVSTGDWQKWTTVSAAIKPTSGRHTLCVVFKTPNTGGDNTTIWAQFKGVDPNREDVEINVRNTVFTPEKTGVNYLTVRGFTLRNAATNWAPPTAGQVGLITAYWCKGWIIEDNDISYSTCSGVALGKYGDEWDGRAGSTEGYVGTLTRALKDGWNKATVGSHLVRNNHISFCGQTGIVGSLGCSFSTVSGNVIHDINNQQHFDGAEMAGIKFHGAIDVTISHNHIYRCGECAGIWLDWMAQGSHVIGNLLHDNTGGCGDLFLEMQHGPILVANNIMLSHCVTINGQGVAFVHNLMAGSLQCFRGDTRVTPFQETHSTAVAGMYPGAKGDSGDDRFYNNLVIAPCNFNVLDNAAFPCFAADNVYLKGAPVPKFDKTPTVASNFDPAIGLTEQADGWYLRLAVDKAWADGHQCKPVTTDLLGKARVPDEAFENADGSPLRIDADYHGNPRDTSNPFPGPFEAAAGGVQNIKVW